MSTPHGYLPKMSRPRTLQADANRVQGEKNNETVRTHCSAIFARTMDVCVLAE
jgi:hypothetical protein